MPKFSLDQVKSLIQQALDGDRSKVWFSGRSRSIDYVIFVYQGTESEAEFLILQGLLKLQPRDYARSVVMVTKPEVIVADEYGLEQYQGHNWYIKFLIQVDDGEVSLTSISFHRSKKSMQI